MISLLLTYENKNGIAVECKKSVHVPPHLHEAVEMVYVTSGTVELGVGQELYHMETGDFAVVFPNVIHHYQVFGAGENMGIYLFLEASMLPLYYDELQRLCPRYPVIAKKDVHVDIVNVVQALACSEENEKRLVQAYVQLIMAHVFSEMEMIAKDSVGGDDIIYRAVEYVAKRYREEIYLEKMAFDLGVSKYVLSRMFAKTFHCNFNQYINSVRINYAMAMLESSKESITNICLDCGFESQRTFNRAFKERCKMTPKEYRNRVFLEKKAKLITEEEKS